MNLMNITNNRDNKEVFCFVFSTVNEPVFSAIRVYQLHSITQREDVLKCWKEHFDRHLKTKFG